MLPLPFREVEVISCTPDIRANIASNLQVTSDSKTFDVAFRIPKLTLMDGNDWSGLSFTGNIGKNTNPIIVRHSATIITVNDDVPFFNFCAPCGAFF